MNNQLPSVYDKNFIIKDIKGNDVHLNHYKNKILMIVNTASKCGFTPQYAELQQLYLNYKDKGLNILGFPSGDFMNQEFDSEKEIIDFISKNYSITFPMFSKTHVKTKHIHPLFEYLITEARGMDKPKKIKWNFTKFLLDNDGRLFKRFEPKTTPFTFEDTIKQALETLK